MADHVNHPDHYQGTIECIDAINAALSTEGYLGFCTGNIIKYAFRWQKKNGAEDLQKLIWYAQAALQALGDSSDSQKQTS